MTNLSKFFCLLALMICSITVVPTVYAQFVPDTETFTEATESSDVMATASSEILELTVPSNTEGNITKVETPVQSELTSIIENKTVGTLNPANFMQHGIRHALSRGIPINAIVFLLLFPLISSVIAVARHVIGLSGFSMFAPAALAVALLSIGIVPGSALFVSVILLSAVGKSLLPYLKLPYMPRTAMLLWFVSVGMFGLLVVSTYVPFLSLSIPNLFALLILILLSENFLEIQATSNPWIALQRAFETFILALFCAFILDWRLVQATVLLYPELFLLTVGVANFLTGKYLGLRLTEWFRFRNLMETEE